MHIFPSITGLIKQCKQLYSMYSRQSYIYEMHETCLPPNNRIIQTPFKFILFKLLALQDNGLTMFDIHKKQFKKFQCPRICLGARRQLHHARQGKGTSFLIIDKKKSLPPHCLRACPGAKKKVIMKIFWRNNCESAHGLTRSTNT